MHHRHLWSHGWWVGDWKHPRAVRSLRMMAVRLLKPISRWRNGYISRSEPGGQVTSSSTVHSFWNALRMAATKHRAELRVSSVRIHCCFISSFASSKSTTICHGRVDLTSWITYRTEWFVHSVATDSCNTVGRLVGCLIVSLLHKGVLRGFYLFVCLGFNGTFSTNRLYCAHNSRIIYHVGAGDNTNT